MFDLSKMIYVCPRCEGTSPVTREDGVTHSCPGYWIRYSYQDILEITESDADFELRMFWGGSVPDFGKKEE